MGGEGGGGRGARGGGSGGVGFVRCWRGWGLVAGVVLVMGLAGWFGGGAVAGWVLEGVGRKAVRAAGWEWVAGRVEVVLGRGVFVRGWEGEFEQEGVGRGRVRVEEVVLVGPRAGEFLQSLVKRGLTGWAVRVRGVEGEFEAGVGGAVGLPEVVGLPEWVVPVRVEVGLERWRSVWDGGRLEVREAGLVLDRRVPGRVWAGGGEVEVGGKSVAFGFLSGRTGWRGGVVGVGGVELGRGWVVDEVRVGVEGGAWVVGLGARVGEGWVRAQGRVSGEVGEGTVWCGGVKLGSLAGMVGGEGEWPAGEVEEAFLQVRGRPGAGEMGELAGRVKGSGLRWRGAELGRVEAGFGVSERVLEVKRLVVEGEGLRIEGSAGLRRRVVGASGFGAGGEGLWGWRDWKGWTGSVRVAGDVGDLGVLARWGEALGWASGVEGGKLEAVVALDFGDGEVRGKWEAGVEGLRVAGRECGDGRFGGSLDGRFLEVERGEWVLGGDRVRVGGLVRLGEPFFYRGEVVGRVSGGRERADWARAVVGRVLGEEAGRSAGEVMGRLGVAEWEWRGDGSGGVHSGAVKVRVDGVVPWVEGEGLGEGGSGEGWFRAEGTYSPGGVWVPVVEAGGAGVEVGCQVAAGPKGLHVGGLRVVAAGREVLAGRVYAPWNPLVLMAGRGWQEGWIEGGRFDADVRGREVPLAGLARVGGVEGVAGGAADVVLGWEGVAGSLPEWRGRVAVRGLQVRGGGQEEVEVLRRAEVEVRVREGRGVAEGRWQVAGTPEGKVWVEFPFGFEVVEGEGLRWTGGDGALAGRVELPVLELERLAAGRGWARRVGGRVSGSVDLGGRFLKPEVRGRVRLEGGELELRQRGLAEWRGVRGVVEFDGAGFVLRGVEADAGAGKVVLTGGGRWGGDGGVEFDVRCEGREALVYRDRSVRLRADWDVRAAGRWPEGRVSGRVGLRGGRVFQRLEMGRFLRGGGGAGGQGIGEIELPQLPCVGVAPFEGWGLDVGVATVEPVKVMGDAADGEVVGDVRLGGRLGAPVLRGTVEVRDAAVALPASVLKVERGVLRFDGGPRVAVDADVRARARVMSHDVEMTLRGPLEMRNVMLRSEPPLPPEQIWLLMVFGLAPGETAGAGFGEAALGQSGVYALRSLLRQVAPRRWDTDALLRRLEVTSSVPERPGGRPLLRGQFFVTEGFSIFSQRDGDNYLGGGAAYRWRFW